MDQIIFTICYAIVAIYKLTYVSPHYKTLRWSAGAIGLHLFVIVVRNGLDAAGVGVPFTWRYVHWVTIAMAAAACIYQFLRDHYERD